MPLLFYGPFIGFLLRRGFFFKLIVQAFKSFSSPGYLSTYFQSRVYKTKYRLRPDLAITFEVTRAKNHAGDHHDHAFPVAGPHLWNGLPSNVRNVDHNYGQVEK